MGGPPSGSGLSTFAPGRLDLGPSFGPGALFTRLMRSDHDKSGPTELTGGAYARLIFERLNQALVSASLPLSSSNRPLLIGPGAPSFHQLLRCVREARPALGSSDNDGAGAASCQGPPDGQPDFRSDCELERTNCLLSHGSAAPVQGLCSLHPLPTPSGGCWTASLQSMVMADAPWQMATDRSGGGPRGLPASALHYLSPWGARHPSP